jgi:hypothetical protein
MHIQSACLRKWWKQWYFSGLHYSNAEEETCKIKNIFNPKFIYYRNFMIFLPKYFYEKLRHWCITKIKMTNNKFTLIVDEVSL